MMIWLVVNIISLYCSKLYLMVLVIDVIVWFMVGSSGIE